MEKVAIFATDFRRPLATQTATVGVRRGHAQKRTEYVHSFRNKNPDDYMSRAKQAIRLLVLMVALLSGTAASAYDFCVDGICYNVVSLADLTCSVGGTSRSGHVMIPEQVACSKRTLQVTAVDACCFIGNSVITGISIPPTVMSIGSDAFARCTSLESVNIRGQVRQIGNYAFEQCSHLKSVTLGRNVGEIGERAFENCPELESITLLSPTPPVADDNTFSTSTYLAATLYVPQGSLQTYKQAACWRNFLMQEIDAQAVE